MDALRQQTARECNLSMDELKLVNSWSRGGISNSKIPAKVTGIKMEGALFDGIKLSECSWDSPTYATTPTCTIAWIPDSSSDHYRVNEAIKLPL